MKLREVRKRRAEIDRIRSAPTVDAHKKSMDLAAAKGQEYMLFGSVLRTVRDELTSWSLENTTRYDALLRLVEEALGPNWK